MRVFTDERFPGVEVHNSGYTEFRVYNRSGGKLSQIDTFVTYSDAKNKEVGQDEAERRARAYFDRMADTQAGGGESEGEGDLLDLPGDPDRDHSEIVNNPPGENKSLDDMIGPDEVLTSDQVIDAYHKANSYTNKDEREAALKQVASMSQQMESASQELVRRLLD